MKYTKKQHRWTKEEIEELESLIITKTNPELANYFEVFQKVRKREIDKIKKEKK